MDIKNAKIVLNNAEQIGVECKCCGAMVFSSWKKITELYKCPICKKPLNELERAMLVSFKNIKENNKECFFNIVFAE